MNTEHATYLLLTWLSPAYPVGAYSFSHGLEAAVEQGFLSNADEAAEWIGDLLLHGDGHADLVFLKNARDAAGDGNRLLEINELALAFQPSLEIRRETIAQGNAFLKTTGAAWPCPEITCLLASTNGQCAYPVAVAAAATGHGIGRDQLVEAYAHAFIANLVSAAVRLVPLGQTDGQRIMSRLLGVAELAIASASTKALSDVSSSCFMADILSMQHETQYTRLFQS